MTTARLYRSLVRQVAQAVNELCIHLRSISPPAQRNKVISASLRRLFERHAQSSEHDALGRDVEDIVTFLRSQREYKTLVDRYNPLVDLTSEERVEATARRVGLNMPKVD